MPVTTTTPSTTTIAGGTSTSTTTTGLSEPFETNNNPEEVNFIKDLGIGMSSLTTGFVGGLILLVFALSVATIILLIGRRVGG
jgi:hypothetical protein